jgi:hypothetical protein
MRHLVIAPARKTLAIAAILTIILGQIAPTTSAMTPELLTRSSMTAEYSTLAFSDDSTRVSEVTVEQATGSVTAQASRAPSGSAQDALNNSEDPQWAYVRNGTIWLRNQQTGVETAIVANTQARQLAWSYDGRYLTYYDDGPTESSNTGQAGGLQLGSLSFDTSDGLYILDLDEATPQPKLLAQGSCCAAWAPDRPVVAYYVPQQRVIRVVDLNNQVLQEIGGAGEDATQWHPPMGPMVWTSGPTQTLLMIAEVYPKLEANGVESLIGDYLQEISLTDSSVRYIPSPLEKSILPEGHLAVSPDGQTLAVTWADACAPGPCEPTTTLLTRQGGMLAEESLGKHYSFTDNTHALAELRTDGQMGIVNLENGRTVEIATGTYPTSRPPRNQTSALPVTSPTSRPTATPASIATPVPLPPSAEPSTDTPLPPTREPTITPPDIPFGCVGFGQCPTETPLPQKAGNLPELKVTAFTLADQLTDFRTLKIPTELQPNTLWVQVTNVGKGAFSPQGGTGEYLLQVLLKGSLGVLEQYDFAPSQPFELEPLHSLRPGEAQTLRINELFLFTPTDDGHLEVFLRPDSALGLENSILSVPIMVKAHPDSYARCAATVAQAVLRIIGIRLPPASLAGKLGLGLDASELGLALSTCKDGGCVVMESAIWFSVMIVKYFVGADVGEVLSLVADAGKELGNADIPCLKFSDFVHAVLHQLLLNGQAVNALSTGSPVYPLVIDSFGRRAGFEAGGSVVLEIPGAQAIVAGEQRIILYPGIDPVRIKVTGYAQGTMNLSATIATSSGTGTRLDFDNVPVTSQTVARMSTANTSPKLEITEGSTIRQLQPSRTEHVSSEPQASATEVQSTPTSTATAVPPETTRSAGGGSGLGLVFGLTGLVGAVIVVVTTARRKRPGTGGAAVAAAYLIGLGGQGTFTVKDGVILGRDPSCSLQFADPHVSRRHAQLRYARGTWYVQDLGSTGGTYVNGARVTAAALREGDRVRLGDTELEFKSGG